MSLAEIGTSAAKPLGTHTLRWRDALVALAVTAAIVLAGEAFGAAVTEGARRIVTTLNPVFFTVASPAIVATYQIALLWIVTGWWFGSDQRAAAVGLGGAPVAWWVWPAAIAGLYALKAAASIGVLAAIHGVGPIAGGPAPGGAVPTELSPFGALMRSPAWPLMLIGGILAAVLEELLYRGYLSRSLEASRLGFWLGALLASVVWAALHIYYPLPMQIVLVIMGLALSWLRRQTGSILPGMAWHIANNTIALVALRVMT